MLRSTGNVPAVAALDLGQNWLTGSLNSTLASLGNAANIGLSVYDNQLSGTIPASFTAFSWLALAYNPSLYGNLPTGLVTNAVNKLQAWATYSGGFYSYPWGGNVYNTYIQAPTYSTGYLFGTSIGLDRPLPAIMMDLKAALDPGGTVLTGWTSTTMQFCPPYQTSSLPGQQASSPGYGRWLTGLYKPDSASPATGLSYCNDYGRTPTAPFVYSIAATPIAVVLNNPMGTAAGVTSASAVPQTTAPLGGISSLCLNGPLTTAGLSGSVPVQLRELRTTTVILLSRNSLKGSLPSAWGGNVGWTVTGPVSKGFDSCALLDLSQNQLNATLPSALGNLGAKIGVSLFDNLFSGTIPASYTALNWLALAYNPLLVGVLPTGLAATGKLFAWSGNQNDFFSYTYASAGNLAYGYPPSKEYAGWGSGWLYGTSIGLDRPLVNILLDIKAALDPGGTVLSSWNASQLQPCRPFSSDNGGTIVQRSSSPGYGRGWKYVSTVTTVVNSAEYCQDLTASSVNVYTSPTDFVKNTQLTGGIAGLWLSGLSLRGTVPAALQELRTASAVSLARNLLTGTIPSVWCVPVLRSRAGRISGLARGEHTGRGRAARGGAGSLRGSAPTNSASSGART